MRGVSEGTSQSIAITISCATLSLQSRFTQMKARISVAKAFDNAEVGMTRMESSPQQQKMNLKVGWALPIYGEIHLNVHFRPAKKKFYWTETVSLSMMADFYELVQKNVPNHERFVYPLADLQDEEKLSKMLLQKPKTPFNKIAVNHLVRVAHDLEIWLNGLFLEFVSLFRDVQEMMKQLFFRSLQKIEIYEWMIAG